MSATSNKNERRNYSQLNNQFEKLYSDQKLKQVLVVILVKHLIWKNLRSILLSLTDWLITF
jgi:hypothetical protein